MYPLETPNVIVTYLNQKYMKMSLMEKYLKKIVELNRQQNNLSVLGTFFPCLSYPLIITPLGGLIHLGFHRLGLLTINAFTPP